LLFVLDEMEGRPAATLPPIGIDEKRFLMNHFVLPPLPALVDRLLETVRSCEATANEVAGLLASDPGLVAEILKLVNSAYYGLPRKITEVRHAVAYLGLSEIERIALTATVLKFGAPGTDDAFRHFWFHSFYSALISKRIARKYAKALDAEELHTAVLLHDIGKLVYMKFFPDHYRVLAAYCEDHGVTFPEAEQLHGMPSHHVLGAMLAERWRLPELVRRTCVEHEVEHLDSVDGSDPRREELRITCLSNLLANLAAGTLSADRKAAFRDATTRALRCDEQEFLLLMGEVYELKAETEGFLSRL
jgi:putative nucleotidyltransferase with HDIG domain